MKRLLNTFEDRLTVRQQIAFGTALLCLVLVSGLAAAAASMSRAEATRFVSAEMRGLATSVAERLDASMTARLREIQFLASAEPMLARWRSSDAGAVRRALDEIRQSHPEFSWIGFVRPDGTVKAATDGQMQGQSVGAQAWFRQALKEPFVEEVRGERVLDDPVAGATGKLPFTYLKLAFPVQDAGGLLAGVLAFNLGEDWLGAIGKAVLQPMEGADRATIWVLGSDGSVLSGGAIGSRPYSEERIRQMRVARQGSFTDDLLPGPSLAGFAVADGPGGADDVGWIVVARRSLAVAALSWRALVDSILLLGAALAVVGILMAALLAGRVSRPIRELTTEADRIGRDPNAVMTGRHSGSREVVELSTALRSLVRRLSLAEARSQEIEQEAAEEARKLNEDVHLLRSLAEADPMTGLLNRRAFANASVQALADFEHRKISLAVLVIDIDHFKRVNDTFGHSAGDAVLRSMGELLRSLVRTSDLVSRYGGEEFVVLLRDIQRGNVRMMAETIRGATAGMRVSYEGRDIAITVSIGCAMAHPNDRDFEDLFQRADLALYTAKRGGRNEVQEAPYDPDMLMAAE